MYCTDQGTIQEKAELHYAIEKSKRLSIDIIAVSFTPFVILPYIYSKRIPRDKPRDKQLIAWQEITGNLG